MNELPKYNELMMPTLRVLEKKGTQTNRQLRDSLIELLNVPKELIEQRLPSGNQRILDNRIGWARTYLLKAGLISRPKRATNEITNAGRELLAKTPIPIDRNTLMQFDGFREFVNKERQGAQPVEKPDKELENKTPEERIEEAVFEVKRELQDELLQRVKLLQAEGFEQLVLRLLVGMGYGDSMADVKGVKRGADGGIDGIVNQDHLGLDRVLIQAKKWDGPVGRPIIAEFSGNLDAKGAKKGVVMTTSTFSQPAKDCANEIKDKRIILVDGMRLTELMLKHEVGVSTKQRILIQGMDEDFFIEIDG